MRTIDPDVVTAALSKVRKIDCRAKFRDDRFVFRLWANATDADVFLSMLNPAGNSNGYETHDASAYSTGILRMATKIDGTVGTPVNPKVAIQWIATPTSAWPSWALLNPLYEVPVGTKPGVLGNRIWTRDLDGNIHVLDYNTANGTYTDTDTTYSVGTTDQIALAPISATECYILTVKAGSTVSMILLGYLKVDGAGAKVSSTEWKGAFHGTADQWTSLDAERFGDIDYIHLSMNSGQRAVCVKAVAGEAWSDPLDVFPLDWSDDISKFTSGGVSIVNNILMVSGTLTRSSSGSPMQIYTMGPEHYTAGREMFVGSIGAQDFSTTISSTPYNFRSGQGKIIAVGSYAYFILPGGTRRASLPTWLGGASPSWTYSCNNVKATYDRTGACTLTLDVPSTIDTGIVAGMTVAIEPFLHDWFQLGVFEIDTIQTSRSNGLTKSIIARPKAIKRLSQWKADASYDYWSQSFRRSDPGDQRYNVYLSNFAEDGNLHSYPKEDNATSIMYSTERPGMSYIARVHVSAAGDRTIHFGPATMVYTETKAEAAARLGIPSDQLTAASVETYGVTMLYSNKAPAGWRLYNMVSSTAWAQGAACPWEPLINQIDQTLSLSDCDLMLVYAHGQVEGFYKASTDTDWTTVIPATRYDLFKSGDYVLPFKRMDGRGRAGYVGRRDGALWQTTIERAGKYAMSLKGYVEDTSYKLVPPVTYNGELYENLEVRDGIFAASYNSHGSTYGTPQDMPFRQTDWSILDPSKNQPWDNIYKNDIIAANTNSNDWYWLIDQFQYLGAAGTPVPIDYFDGCLMYLSRSGLEWAFEIDMYDYSPPYMWRPAWQYETGLTGIFEAWAHQGNYSYGDWQKWFWYPYYPGVGAPGLARTDVVRVHLRAGTIIGAPNDTWGMYRKWRVVPAVKMKTIYPLLEWSGLWGKTVYRGLDAVPLADDFLSASGDPDRSFSWMATEIARKAGVLGVSIETAFTTFSSAHSGFNLNTDGSTQIAKPRTGIVRFKVQAEEIGVMAASSGGILGGSWNGEILTVSTTYARLYGVVNGVITLKEKFPIGAKSKAGTWAEISFTDDKACLWINDAPIISFPLSTTIKSLMMVASAATTTDVDWPVLDMRVDNFVIDINRPALDALRRLIKQKRIYFGDDSNGGLKIFREGTTINTEGTAYNLVVTSGKTDTDIARLTRLRLEGIELYEAANETDLLEYGNVFALENFDELDYHEQFIEEADLYLDEMKRANKVRTYRGAADPRVEPWDKIWINDGAETKLVVVRTIAFVLSISEDGAVFDMELEAEEK
jgi:hypothetical protein